MSAVNLRERDGEESTRVTNHEPPPSPMRQLPLATSDPPVSVTAISITVFNKI